MPSKATNSFTVAIIGGSKSGLILANALALQHIQCFILEAKTDLLTNAGAALTIGPNGTRILDQLGVFQEIANEAAPILVHRTWLESGRFLSSVDLTRLPSRSGYGFLVIERRALLSVLLRHVTTKVKLGKRVVRIENTPSYITVHCEDGSIHTGHLVVGADGIHGVTHGEMCRNMARGRLPPKLDDCTLTATYSGIFGTSTRTAGLTKGIANRTDGHGSSFIVTVGKDERVHWYLAIRRRTRHSIRHYDKRDIDHFIQPYLSVKVAKGVCFDQIYQKCITCCHVPLEEALQPRWAWGRFVCIGDAAHKVTPNIAQGANCAIETAASLANHLSRADKHRDLDLERWSHSRRRKVQLFYWASQILVRVEASSSWMSRWLGWYIGSFHGAFVMDTLAGISSYAERVEFLPIPDRADVPVGFTGGYVILGMISLVVFVLWLCSPEMHTASTG